MRRVLAGLLCAFALLVSPAFAAGTSAPDAAGLRADAAILRRAYEAMHPGLYRYNTPVQMDRHFQELDAELGRAGSLQDAFLAFTRFTATLECGHSYPNFYNQSDAVARELFQHQDRVPFYFEWLNRRMIVTRNFSNDSRLKPGTEIVEINGTPAGAILSALLPLARADGSNDAKRIDQMAVRGDDRYEPFDIYFPMLFPQHSATMSLAIRTAAGESATVTATALTYEQRIAPIAAKLAATNGSGPLWSLRYLDAATAYLKMPTWETYNSKWDWKADIERSFADLAARHARTLIVDLRGNEGGTDVGNAILAHLTGAPLHLDAYRRLVRYRTAPSDLLPYLDTWDPSFKDWGTAAVPFDERFFRLTKYDDDANGDVIAPTAPRFNGSMYVLVDASNSSATFQFDDAVQRNHLGTLVGTPTGGNQRGINGGAFFFIRLPNSGLEVDLPLIGTFPVQTRPDAGLTPDVLIENTARDIASGADPQLQAALAAR
jgi:hypothetical protein